MAASSSSAYLDRARAVMTGKQSNFRPGPDQPPIVAARAEGLRIFDVDGRDYIDFTLAMGPAVFGYGDAELGAAVAEQYARLSAAASGAMITAGEVELCERIVEHVPCAEKVRLGISGSEAVQLAMRLARGTTGRRYVLRFHGHYHGWMDTAWGGQPGTDANPEFSKQHGAGLAEHCLDDVLMIRWNDVEALERVLARHGRDVALCMMEAVMCNTGCCPPRPGYLETVRELCDRHGVLLHFDEVITGFRMGLGGAQGALGVTPDLATFGKAMAGGLPLSALAGRDEVMAGLAENRVLGGGTFNSFPLAVASSIATLDRLAADDAAFYRALDDRQRAFEGGFMAAAAKSGHDVLLQGPRGFLYYAFTDLDIAHTPDDLAKADFAKAMRFRGLLEEEGVLSAGGFRFVTTPAMDEATLDEALHRITRAFQRL